MEAEDAEGVVDAVRQSHSRNRNRTGNNSSAATHRAGAVVRNNNNRENGSIVLR